jgi:hypothetical protein
MTGGRHIYQDRSKGTVVERVKRQPTAKVVASDLEATQASHEPMPQTTEAEDGRESHERVGAVMFPLCDAAVRKTNGGEWELADAILAECSDPGENGVRNGSQAKMKEMQEEIAKNHGVELSVVRISKLRRAASTFPAGRRRPGVSLEGHLTAGTPEALDEFIKSAPKGTALTCKYIRQQKYPTEKADQDQQKAERRLQEADHQKALQGFCRQLECEKEQLGAEKDEYKQRYVEQCGTLGKEPEPLAPPLAPEDQPELTVAEDLTQGLRGFLLSRGFDLAADNIKLAIADFVKAVLAQQP